jgi:hypothetical protein
MTSYEDYCFCDDCTGETARRLLVLAEEVIKEARDYADIPGADELRQALARFDAQRDSGAGE